MSSPSPHLPPGLDPVSAGRWGLWLLGKRSQAAAKKRFLHVAPVGGDNISGRLLRLICPWSIAEYPGWQRTYSGLLGLKIGTAQVYLYSPRPLPVKHIRRIAEISREREAAFRALAEDAEAYAAERERTMKPQGLPWSQKKRGG